MLLGVGVIDESVLARRRVAVVAHCDSRVVHRKYLGEHESRSRLTFNDGDLRIGNWGSREDSIFRVVDIGGEAVEVPIGANIESNDQAEVVHALSVRHIGSGGRVDLNEPRGPLMRQEEAWGFAVIACLLAHNCASVVDAKCTGRIGRQRQSLQLRAVRSNEEGRPVITPDDAAHTVGAEGHTLGSKAQRGGPGRRALEVSKRSIRIEGISHQIPLLLIPFVLEPRAPLGEGSKLMNVNPLEVSVLITPLEGLQE